MAWGIGSFEARKTQCLEASHTPRPFTLDAQSHGAGGRESRGRHVILTRLEHSPGSVKRLKALLFSCLESFYARCRTLHQPVKITGAVELASPLRSPVHS